MTEEICRQLFTGNHDSRKLAESINEAMPNAACEMHSVSAASPGPVKSDELLIRLSISPRDFDEETGQLALAPFEKVFEQGLSVLRECATNDECIEQVLEILPHKPEEPAKAIRSVTIAHTAEVRQLTHNEERIFAVYDQVVPRFRSVEKPPVGAHAGVFSLKIPKGPVPKDQIQPKQLKKDLARKAYNLFLKGEVAVQNFRENLFEEVNRKASERKFEIKVETKQDSAKDDGEVAPRS